MRILLVTEPAGGGSGRHVLDLAAGLSSNGHEVTVIWSPDRAEKGWQESVASIPSVRSLPLHMTRSISWRDFVSWRSLSKFVKETGPYDILHGHSSKAGALVRLLPPHIPGRRVYTPHAFRTMDPNSSFIDRMIFHAIELLLSSFTSSIIVVSEAEWKHALSLGISTRRLAKIINGVDVVNTPPRAAVRATLGLDDDSFAVGFIGRLSPQKDPIRFVHSIQFAQQENDSIVGVIIGDGELGDIARDLAAQDRIIFTGWADSRKLMPGLDMLVMTSLYEAMPYVLLEALCAGLPIITTRVGGAAEAVVEGSNGVILAPDSTPETIGLEIARRSRNASWLASASKSSHELASRLSTRDMVDNTLSCYTSHYQSG